MSDKLQKRSEKVYLSPEEELEALLKEHQNLSQMIEINEDVQSISTLNGNPIDLNESIREREKRMLEIADKIAKSPELTNALTKLINPGA